MQKVRLLVKGSKRNRTPPKCAAIPWGCRGVVRWVRPATVAWVEEERWTSEWRELEWDRQRTISEEGGGAGKMEEGRGGLCKKGRAESERGGHGGGGREPREEVKTEG